MRHPHLKIERLQGPLTAADRQSVINIILHYFPIPNVVDKMLDFHLAHSDAVIVARLQGRLIGLSLACKLHAQTPYARRPLNIVFERALFVDPEVMFRGLGKRLIVATLRNLLGWFWFGRRFAVICRTQNPTVARMLKKFQQAFPKPGEPLPDDILAFGRRLLPQLGATELEASGRLAGSLDEFKDYDHTEIWQRYYHIRDDAYEQMILNNAFVQRDGRILNRGHLLFFTAYSKPWQLMRYLFN